MSLDDIAAQRAESLKALDRNAPLVQQGGPPRREDWRPREIPSGPPLFQPLEGSQGAWAKDTLGRMVGEIRRRHRASEPAALREYLPWLARGQLQCLMSSACGLSASEQNERQGYAKAMLGEIASKLGSLPELREFLPREMFVASPPFRPYPPRERWEPQLTATDKAYIAENMKRVEARAAQLKAELPKTKQKPTEESRFVGAMMASAVGDCLGSTVEFKDQLTIRFQRGMNTDLIGGGPFGWLPGEPTDDTQMTLAAARAIVDRGGFDQTEVAANFVDWYNTRPKDIGALTGRTLSSIARGTPADLAGLMAWIDSGYENAGNGSVMRATPVALLAAFSDDATQLRLAQQNSEITHSDPRCVYGCLALFRAMRGIFEGKTNIVDDVADHLQERCPSLADAIRAVKTMPESALRTTGYVTDTVQAAFWALEHSQNLVDALLIVANNGDDTDTAGATAGMLLGAKFGAEGIPPSWKDRVIGKGEIEDLAREIYAIAKKPGPSTQG